MNARAFFAPIAAALLMLAGAQGAHAEPLRISYFIWVGYGPLFVARDKGFFAKEGVEVELINIEDHGAVVAALSVGQIQAVAGALQDAATFSYPDELMQCVTALSLSSGGEGILAANDIRSVPDLKGRSVAVLRGSVLLYYLNVVLNAYGLSQADVEIVDLSHEDSATAFVLQQVDAAVTQEPWLSEVEGAEHGHRLIDSADGPGGIYDCLVTPAAVFKARKSDFEAIGRAWDAAVRYARTQPDEANRIMMKGLGLDEDPAAFAGMLETIEWLDGDDNREFFGTADQPGTVEDTMQEAIDVLSQMGELKMEFTPADVIAHGVWDDWQRGGQDQ